MRNYEKVPGVNYDIDSRWENGVDHHPKSEEMARKLGKIDLHFNNDQFCFKFGGDGDNGETLMYLLDIYFEELDKGEQS